VKYKDYYQTLGVARDATPEEIKRAYRKLARKFHPDVSREPDAEARFKEVNEAYEVLKDPARRSAYDGLGGRWHAGEEFSPPPGWTGFDFGAADVGGAEVNFSDFFESLFGSAAPFGGSRIHVEESPFAAERAETLLIDLEEAYRGTTRTVQIDGHEIDAQGRLVQRPRAFNVKIPPGVTDGQRIRLAGSGPRGRPGRHTYLQVKIRPHPLFRLEGRDIYLDLPLAPWEAALGARVEVPTLAGRVELRVPPGTQSGSRLRLRERGLPGSPPGDQYAVAQIMAPPAAGEAQRRLYQRMAEEMPFDPRAGWPATR
jgi:curved DNA-binding protein